VAPRGLRRDFRRALGENIRQFSGVNSMLGGWSPRWGVSARNDQPHGIVTRIVAGSAASRAPILLELFRLPRFVGVGASPSNSAASSSSASGAAAPSPRGLGEPGAASFRNSSQMQAFMPAMVSDLAKTLSFKGRGDTKRLRSKSVP